MGSTGITSCPLRGWVDPRALRFSAAAAAIVLAVVMLTAGPLGLWLSGCWPPRWSCTGSPRS